LTGTTGVTLRGLVLDAPLVIPEKSPRDELLSLVDANEPGADVNSVLGQFQFGFGVRAVSATELTLEKCTITLLATRGAAVRDVFAAAVFLQGNCRGLTVRGCSLGTPISPTFTPFTSDPDTTSPAAGERFKLALNRLSAAPMTSVSAPLSVDGLLVNRVNAAANTVVARRLTLGAVAPKPCVATVGVIAANHISTGENEPALDCELGNAIVADNAFSALTIATWLSAGMGTLRLQDNSASNGVAGLWLEVPGAWSVPNPVPSLPGLNYPPDALAFDEFWLAAIFAALYPLPVSSAARARTVLVATVEPSATAAVSQPAETTIFVLGNKIEMRGAAGSDQDRGSASSALLMSLVSSVGGAIRLPPYLSVIVAMNHLRSPSYQFAPTAVVAIPGSQPCAITGNVVLDVSDLDRRGTSLWVVCAQFISAWTAATVVADGATVVPTTSNGYYYSAASPGATGNSEPAWPLTLSASVVDGKVTWTCAGVNGTELLSVTGNVLSGKSDLAFLPRAGAVLNEGWHIYNAEQA